MHTARLHAPVTAHGLARSVWAMCRARLALAVLLLLGALFLGESQASALEPAAVPAPLQPWVPWVLEELGDELCPRVGDSAACVWPGRLTLLLDADGGRFRLSARLDRFATLELPGADKQWPEDVVVNGKSAVVLGQGGVPTLNLQRGQHMIEGRFFWRRLPETLAVPVRAALVELTLLGERVPLPRRDAGRLWLKGGEVAPEEQDSLTLEVFRKLTDDVPFRVQTQLVLQVSGRARELGLRRVLPEGALPIELTSKLPARLERNGDLLLQVYPGRHDIGIDALYASPPERITAPALPSPWPPHEVWAFVPATEQRQVQITGGLGTDPARTNLPEAWRALAAYQLEGGGALTLETLRRGQATPPPNRVAIERELWLDLDGNGFTVRDRIQGSLRRGWRLDLLQGELGHVAANGTDQLITMHPTSGARGVELRQSALDLTAEWRLAGALRELPAVAWSENVDQLSSNLYLPPGWQLLSVNGADSVSESWLSRWNLFALFFVLVVAIAVARLDRPVWGALGLLALVLAHGEAQAPEFVWGVVLLSIALLKGLPAGRFRDLVRLVAVGAGLFLLISSVTFSVSQIRMALYPQVSQGVALGGFESLGGAGDPFSRAMEVSAPRGDFAQMAPLPQKPMQAPGAMEEKMQEDAAVGRGRLGSMNSIGGGSLDSYAKSRSSTANLEQDPHALIQTGPGVPSWSWKGWHLGWSGPVDRAHTLRLYLLSPDVGGALCAIRILLIGVFTFWALRLLMLQARPPRAGRAAQPAAALLLLPVLALAFAARPARADIPSPELLQELKQRVSPPRACTGECVEVPRLTINVGAASVSVKAEVHAGAPAAYKLPGPAARWLPARVTLDDDERAPLLLGDDGFLYLRLTPGRHSVLAEGPLVGRELTLDPGTTPRLASVDARGWEVTGLSESGQIEGSLQFVRPLPASESERASEGLSSDAAALPSWAMLTRTFKLGVSWTVESQLSRVGPTGSMLLVRVPLAPGERVTSASVPTEAGFAVLRLLGDAQTASFESVLEPRPELKLTAAANAGYSERWVLRCGPIFRCEPQGLAPIQHEASGFWVPTFAPWPGESLSVQVVRPAAAIGQTATVDQASLELRPGVRLLRAELEAQVRASTQTTYELRLPEGSEVDQLSIDSRPEPIRQEGSLLKLVFAPGQHTLHVAWQEPGGFRTLFRTPKVGFGQALNNVRVSVHLPDERWLLAAGGPAWGPAILFWGHLVLILLLAPVLARLPRSRLKAWEWALLTLGLTQVPLVVAGLVFGWFFLIAWHDFERPEKPLGFNLRQLGLILVTFLFLGCLFGAVYDSLLNTPDMDVMGAGSHNRLLNWYLDRSAGELPQAWVVSTSLWVWRGVMLLWALWLASNLVGWLKWAWFEAFATGVWKPWRKRGT